jgi:transposase
MATRVDITLVDLHRLQERIDRQQLEEDDWVLIGALVAARIARTEARQVRLRAKAGEAAAADLQAAQETAAQTGVGPGTDAGHGSEAEGTAATGAAVGGDPMAPHSKKRGHGRNGADAFVNATTHVHALADGILGAVCAHCRIEPVSPYRDKVIVRVIGQSLFAAERHEFEQGRCRLCGAIYTAQGREQILETGLGSDYITYDWSACAMMIVMHYFAGAPFKRLEALQQGWGVPMPDANQWRLADAADDLVDRLYRTLERYAIQNAMTLRFDDTGSMIVDERRQIHKELAALELLGASTRHVRTGINATCCYLETPQGKVILFFTGRHHAGEVVDQLLQQRRASAQKLVAVTDAASKNFAHDREEQLDHAVCHAHCYLKFRAVKGQFPAEYAVAGEVYAKVFDHDDQAKALGLDAQQRMSYHRQHSQPQMLRLWQMCKEKADGHLVEPNSPLWEPIAFVINQWPRLTKFYEVPGVPLDSNLVEQALVIPVRYLAGSFAYKTQNGADVGDRHMSLIATANANGVEPVAYLTECLRHHADLAQRPEHYLPWVYRHRLEALDGDLGGLQAHTPSPSGPSPPPRVGHPLRPGTRGAHGTPRSASSAPAPARA